MRQLLISILLALVYWIPATIVLFNIFSNDSIVFSKGIDDFLLPGYFLGFVFGFAGGETVALLGQIITLVIITFLLFNFAVIFSKKKRES